MSVDLDAYREESRDTWGSMAPGWEARREWMRDVTGRVTEWLIANADPQPGQTVLDIAAGPGDLGLQIAERVQPGGRVLSTDFSPEMLDVARRGGERRGMENVEYRVLDAERMDLADDSVDVAVCRWGYMLMASPDAALSETRRVLREGGRLAFSVWATPDRNPWAAVPAMTLVQRGHMQPPQPGSPGIFALGDEGRIRELVSGAGFDAPEIEAIEFDFRYADFDDLWDALVSLAGPLARAIAELSADEVDATRNAIQENVEQFRRDDGSYQAPAATWGVVTR